MDRGSRSRVSLAIVVFLWRPRDRKARYGAAQVNTIKRMLDMHAPAHRLVCVTDDAEGIDHGVHIVPIEERLVAAQRRYPKLMFYRRDAAELFGADRIAMIDLDCVVTGSLDRIFARQEPLIVWDDPSWTSTPYNSSLVVMDAGCAPQVYEKFEGARSNAEVERSRMLGSDQVWLALVMGRDLPKFTSREGVLLYHTAKEDEIKRSSIVFFPGNQKPWDDCVTEPWAKTWWP
jgi:hypothetical protein